MTHPHAHPEGQGAGEAPLDVRERGAQRDGQPQTLDRRLFMQLLVLDCRPEPGPTATVQKLGAELRAAGVGAVIYEDVNDPFGVGLLTFTEEPADFLTKVRPAITKLGATVTLRPDFTMLGRSYSSGFENDLEFWLLKRPRETVLNEAWPWAIWYPLRRTGAFARLEPREQGGILREHGNIGKSYGAADLAHDVRLACHGLDAKDNEFLIGLIGKELHPLSHVVQAMRSTRQTAEFIAQMGPFFVGRAVVRTPGG
jgi:chlorite dismutase